MKKELFIKTLIAGIVFLFVNASFVSAFNIKSVDEYKPMNLGNWLFVGGSGPGNYSKIQDAINTSVDGDTVFVYDDSSPYYENIIIEKSITLIGENRETTTILGDDSLDGVIVNISADDVGFGGFTIQPRTGKTSGIDVYKNYTSPDYWNIGIIQNVTIFNNIIKKVYWAGIFGIRLNNGNIYGNIIENIYGSGIYLSISSNNTISNNVIVNCSYRGIEIVGMWCPFRIKNYLNPVSQNNIISHNTIKSNRWGIGIYSGPINTKITNNNITDSQGNFPDDGIGIDIYQASKTQISQNNLIGNSINAYISIINGIRYPKFLQNSWDKNYWGEPKNIPVRIKCIYYFIPFPRLPFSISFPNYDFNFKEIPWITFDWHPVKEPYDI
jgi:parallel beta-helix repeat protein